MICSYVEDEENWIIIERWKRKKGLVSYQIEKTRGRLRRVWVFIAKRVLFLVGKENFPFF